MFILAVYKCLPHFRGLIINQSEKHLWGKYENKFMVVFKNVGSVCVRLLWGQSCSSLFPYFVIINMITDLISISITGKLKRREMSQ